MREIPRLRVKPGATIDPATFETGYADMAIESWAVFERMQKAGEIPAGVKFQISIPTPIAPTYNNMVPRRPAEAAAAADASISSARCAKIAKALPNDRIAIQWDVCQEVLAWEGYYDKGPVDFRTETIDVLTKIGDGVPAADRARLPPLLRQPGRRAHGAAEGHGHHGRDDQRHRRRRQAADPVRPYAGDQGAHRRRLFRAAEEIEAQARHRALSRPDPPQRCGRRRGAPRRRAASRAGRRHRHRMRHGARRSGAAAGAARGARQARKRA